VHSKEVCFERMVVDRTALGHKFVYSVLPQGNSMAWLYSDLYPSIL
jgi:hypothetical protein